MPERCSSLIGDQVLVNEHIYSAILLSSTALDDVGGHMLRIAHANGKDLELMRKVSIPAELKVPGASYARYRARIRLLHFPSFVLLLLSPSRLLSMHHLNSPISFAATARALYTANTTPYVLYR